MLHADEPAASRVLLHMPVDVRSASLALIAALLCLFALHWASAVFIPLMMGVMFSYALTPAVDLMSRWRLPRPAG
ncbi:MAG TPA: AI-2E family transporter, partial [Albitalea sp.]|nr:AI-2E family transporter [Albitalea sp.]